MNEYYVDQLTTQQLADTLLNPFSLEQLKQRLQACTGTYPVGQMPHHPSSFLCHLDA